MNFSDCTGHSCGLTASFGRAVSFQNFGNKREWNTPTANPTHRTLHPLSWTASTDGSDFANSDYLIARGGKDPVCIYFFSAHTNWFLIYFHRLYCMRHCLWVKLLIFVHTLVSFSYCPWWGDSSWTEQILTHCSTPVNQSVLSYFFEMITLVTVTVHPPTPSFLLSKD